MKEKTLSMAHQSSSYENDNKIIPPQPLKLKKPHQPKGKKMGQEYVDESQYLEGLVSDFRPRGNNNILASPKKLCGKDNNTIGETSSSSASKVHKKALDDGDDGREGRTSVVVVVDGEDSGRERLKRHRMEVAGRVWIPEIWGQEELLKDWIDCTSFDAPLVPSRIVMARTALVEQGTRAITSSGFRC